MQRNWKWISRVQGHVIHSLNNSLCKQGNLTSDKLALHVNPAEKCNKKEEKNITVITYLDYFLDLQISVDNYATLNIVKHLLTLEKSIFCTVISAWKAQVLAAVQRNAPN